MYHSAPVYFKLDTIALEFRVTDRLDGVTVPEPFVLPPHPDAIIDPDSQAVIVGTPSEGIQTVERLGLIDLTGGVQRGAIADRIVRSILVIGPNPVAMGVTAQIGRSFDGIPDPNGQLTIPVGAFAIDSDNCIKVPQTAMLRLDGLVASPGEPILVRICVWEPHTVEELAQMALACCCRESVFDAEGEPFFTTALFDVCPNVSNSAPPAAPQGVGLFNITINGTGFSANNQVFLVHQGGMATIPATMVTFVNSNNITATVDISATAPTGAYDIVVASPLAPPSCQGFGAGLFTVV